MKLRSKILPKTLVDIVSFMFITIMVLYGYCFELLYVLPAMHPPGSFWFVLHAFMGSFVLVNIASNFVFIMIVDTSVNAAGVPSKGVPSRWIFCPICELHMPPRAWHCSVCNSCILKRDHHCQFTGCCVGHRNHRYFFFFVLYMAVGTAYAACFHTAYIYRCAVHYLSVYRQYHGSFVLALAQSVSFTVQTCFIILYALICFATGASMFFLAYHACTIARGQVMYERWHSIHEYDSGSVKRNFIQVLGERWYLAWISPLVSSRLPGDGVKWMKCNPNKRVI